MKSDQFKKMLAATCLFLLSMVWLFFTQSEVGDEPLFFGRWRTRHFGVTLIGCWILVAMAFSFLSRAAVFRFVLVSVGLGFTVFLLEILGLAGVVNYRQLLRVAPSGGLGSAPTAMLELEGLTYEDLASSWGYPTEAMPFYFKTDRYGLRNHQDRANADIYLLGDSILVAGMLPFEKVVASLLEQDLNRSVMNVALISISPQREVELLKETGLPLENRILLHFIFEGNDMKDSFEWRAKADGTALELSRFERTLTYNALIRLQRATSPPTTPQRRIGRLGGIDYLFGWTRSSFEPYHAELAFIAATLQDLAKNMAEAGGTYGVVFVPSKIRVIGPSCTWPETSSLDGYEEHVSPMRTWLADWAQEQGIPLLDTTDPLLLSTASGHIPWYPGDTHLNAIGHRVMADAIRGWTIFTPMSDTQETP